MAGSQGVRRGGTEAGRPVGGGTAGLPAGPARGRSRPAWPRAIFGGEPA